MRPGKEEEESTATRPKRANVSKNLPAVWHVDNVSIEQAKKKASYLFGFNSNKKKKRKGTRQSFPLWERSQGIGKQSSFLSVQSPFFFSFHLIPRRETL
jgi:hypothetical protein